MTPVRAFLMLVAVAVVVPVTILATRPEAAPTKPPAQPTPDFSLTDAEAIERFRELHELFRRASRSRDATLLRLMLVDESPLSKTAAAQIEQLIDDGVLDRSQFTTSAVRVIENTPTRVRIEQVVKIDPRFVVEGTRKDVSDGRPLIQTVEWTLAPEESTWKVIDSVVVKSERP